MCTDEQHNAVVGGLDRIEKSLTRRSPLFLTVPISDTLSFPIDYKKRRYLFVRSQVALTLLIGSENSVSLPANVWFPLIFRPGDPVSTSGFGTTPTILTTLAIDEPINSLLASITGTPQVSITGTVPVNVTQQGSVPTQMAGADGVAPGNVPEEAVGIYNGTSVDRQRGTQGVADTSTGGRTTATIAAAGSLNVKSSPGRLARVLITVAGTASITFFDNSAGNSTGNIIGVTPATTSIGQVYDFGLPALAGISAVGGAGSPGVTVSYY